MYNRVNKIIENIINMIQEFLRKNILKQKKYFVPFFILMKDKLFFLYEKDKRFKYTDIVIQY